MKNYSEENQFTVFFLILKNYDIIQNLEAIIINNSDINDIFCQKIEAYFLNKKNFV